MYRIAICDDEVFYSHKIEDLIRQYFHKTNETFELHTYISGEQLLKQEVSLHYDIVFLDINMDNINGMEVAEQIRKYDKEIFIVFVTAFISYAPQGYHLDAFRYILKEVDSMKVAMDECLSAFIQQSGAKEQELTFEFQEGIQTVILSHILYIESNLHKLTFHVIKKDKGLVNCTLYGKLDDVERKLSESTFCRIHKSYLVNLWYVENVERYAINLTDGGRLNVAKSRYDKVCQQLLVFKGAI